MSHELNYFQPQLKRSENCWVFHGWDCSNCSPLQTETEHHLTFSCSKMLYYQNSLFLWFFLPFHAFSLIWIQVQEKNKWRQIIWSEISGWGELILISNLVREVFSLIHLSRTLDWESGSSNPNLGQVPASLWAWDPSLMVLLDLDSGRPRFKLPLTDWCTLGNIMLLASFFSWEKFR